MFRKLILILLPLALLPVAFAQDHQNIFDEFLDHANQEFDAFSKQTNSAYVEFMRKNWEIFYGKEPVAPPVHEEPVVPPVVIPEEELEKDRAPRELPYLEVVTLPEQAPAPEPIEPVRPVPAPPASASVSFELYGTQCSVLFDVANKPVIKKGSEWAVADMWAALAGNRTMETTLSDIYRQRKALDLCDWAYYQFVKSFCDAVYPDSRVEARVLLSFIMIQSGFDLKIGLDDAGQVCPLMAVECELYSYPYYQVNGRNYYALEATGSQEMKILEEDFPADLRPMRITIAQENRFAEKLSDVRHLKSEKYSEAAADVTSNMNLIAFYDEYPLAFVNNDMRTKWRFYANVPASRNVRATLYPALRKAVAGKSELDAVSVLLNFVQTAMEYEFDEKVWGEERAFFSDESLYYPYCDCEDRSILFSRLVRDIVGLDVVLVYYPGHLAAAVRFNENVPGDYIACNNSRYTVCDPTYINAPVGVTMPDMDNSSAFVLML